MAKKKHCIAMILAGGQGSRLYALTNRIAKPAVPFGGKYRIIDFPLSNCINSGIDTAGVLTQYQPLVLNEYIGNGQPWDLDRTFGGVHILPPYQAKNSADWYRGTANAIYQNMHYINSFSPENVLILSGDHIYKMNYARMLDFHKKNDADCTISVIGVPPAEASRFGIMNTDGEHNIVSFEEKPRKPKSNLASMGIYIFKTGVLGKFLESDAADTKSSNDFGKNVIPAMLSAGMKMLAYPFEGYWKDVGTVKSLWEANMDLLGEEPAFDIFDPAWVISSRNHVDTPQYHGNRAHVVNSLITGGCSIEGEVINSVIGHGVKIERGASVRDSVIFSGVTIGRGAVVDYSVIDEYADIGGGARIGIPAAPEAEITVVEREAAVGAGAVVLPAQPQT